MTTTTGQTRGRQADRRTKQTEQPGEEQRRAAREVRGRLGRAFASGRTRPLEWRLHQLDRLRDLLTEREDELVAALADDLGKPRFEAWGADLAVTRREVDELRRHLRRWARPEGVRVPFILQPARAEVVPEPLGTVLVISPWNYPVQLVLMPLASAIGAGNTAAVKPSELTPRTSATLARLLPLYLDPECFAVVEGGHAETNALLELRWDHIFYTGNSTAATIVARAAAEHLTPTTLELGGQTPVIVTEDADLTLAAQRITSAKWLNAGQTCVATNHVWVHRAVADQLVERIAAEVVARYGADPRTSPYLARIVTTAHAERLRDLLAVDGAETVVGGEADVEDRYVAPTVLRQVKPDSAVMAEEIFGPILPVLVFDDLDEPLEHVNAGAKPLVIYLFSRDAATVARVQGETSSGAFVVNDTVNHAITPGLPFGGVGGSGYGVYHGRSGFDTFSHRKAVLRRPALYRELPILRPPYARWKSWVARRLL